VTQVEVHPPDGWAAAVADRFEQFLGSHDRPRITLPTGNTPKPFYAELARRQTDMSHVTLFLLDDFGGIAPEHPARCEPMLRRDLLDQLDHPPAFHGFAIDAVDLEAEADRHEAAVRAGGLDLAVLGLGMNGHIALNEPGSAADSLTRVVQLEPSSREAAAEYGGGDWPAPTWGITMGVGTLSTSREIWLLVSGGEKREILHRVLHGPVTPDVPASLLRACRAFRVITDVSLD
jgi:glucosamine-6-phosphate deaminase